MRQVAKKCYEDACKAAGVKPDTFTESHMVYTPPDFNADTLVQEGTQFGILKQRSQLGEDENSLLEFCYYGLKGMAAYTEQAFDSGAEEPEVYGMIWEIYDRLTTTRTVADLLELGEFIGETNFHSLRLLDQGGTQRYGAPEPTLVNTTPKVGKCILVSGHILPDIEAILEQAEPHGIHVYTHNEMLPANAYPGLKKYNSLAGHYGGPWHFQTFEFSEFPGPIVMTSACLVEPRRSYQDRVFCRGVVGYPGTVHIPDRNFKPVIDCALKMTGFEEDDISPSPPLTIGYGFDAWKGVQDKVVDLVKKGAINHFFVIGGCVGTDGEQNYYTKLAKATPPDSIILTAGCVKFRINKLNLGEIGGFPRVLDCGQCNDTYSVLKVAMSMADALKANINELPLSVALSWFEQKAVAIMWTLFHLGIENVRLGPTVPAFVSPNVLKLLKDKYKIIPIGNVEEDMATMLKQHAGGK